MVYDRPVGPSRFISMRPLSIASTVTSALLAAMPLGCASGSSTYASCLREPSAWGEGATRSGVITARGLDTYDKGSQENKFVATISRQDCKDSLRVAGPGVDMRGGPWLPLWDEGFTASYKTNRLAFAYYAAEHQAYVWIDGTSRGPYYDIAISPRFSENGEHVAYLVYDSAKEYTLFTDGRAIKNHPRISDWPFLYVLDDGRVAAPSYREDKSIVIIVGESYKSPPLEDLCQHWGFQAGPRGQWGFAAKSGGAWITVINGTKLDIGGIPSRCEIKFSEDGRHYGYVVLPVAGEPASKRGVVIDGVYHPELELASEVSFPNGVPIATVEERGLPGNGVERVLHVVGQPTPTVAPSRDDYEPRQGASERAWMRVKIGTSLGPRVDIVKFDSIAVDAEGHVKYVAERASEPIQFIDNVMQQRPAVKAVIAQ